MSNKSAPRILETVNPSATEAVDDDADNARDGESKEDAFKRIATARMNKALKMIALLGNLSSAQYASTADQHDAIERALLIQVQATMRKLRKEKRETPTFSL